MAKISLTAPLLCFLTACTLEPLPVHPTQVQVARNESKPVERGPVAPGAVRAAWNFDRTEGYVFDPGKIEIAQGSAHLKRVTKDRYATGRATVETSAGKPFTTIESFTETRAPASGAPSGEIRYQLSNDGSRWFYHDGKRWTQAQVSAEQSNTAADMNRHVPSFHAEAGAGNLFWRAWLISPNGTEQVELKKLEIGLIQPPLDYWD